MNYLKTTFITIILLAMNNIHNEELSTAAPDITDIQNLLTPKEPMLPQQEAHKVEEKSELQVWNDHCALLTANDTYWDTTNNIPKESWKADAFKLAEQLIAQDKSLAETLKSDFFKAINAKTTELTINISNLITKFDNMIDAQLKLESEKAPEQAQSIPAATPTPTTVAPMVESIETKPEPVSEPVPTPPTETFPTPETSDTPATPTSQPKTKDLKTEWKELLKNIETDDNISSVLGTAYEVAQNLLLSGGNYTPQSLQADFYNALETRMIQKKINPQLISTIKNSFNEKMFPFARSDNRTPFFAQGTANLEMEKLREELAAKEARAQEDKKLHEKKMMEVQAALALQGKTAGNKNEEEIHELALKMQQMKQVIAQDAAKRDKEIKEARQALAKNIEQLAATQKAESQKGMLASITDWWSGNENQQKIDLLKKELKKSFKILAQNSREPALVEDQSNKFLKALFMFNDPNEMWFTEIGAILDKLVTQYHVILLPEALDIIRKVLQSSGKVSIANLKAIMSRIEKPYKDREKQLLEERQKKEAIDQQIAQRKQDRLLDQQRIKDEQDRIETEKKQSAATLVAYADVKKNWYELLDQVAQNKQATPHENHAHTQEAIKKSQSLLHLATIIPTKDKSALSQKLKQKFSIALLDQQKGNDELINIHHNMDVFNQEINKMMD